MAESVACYVDIGGHKSTSNLSPQKWLCNIFQQVVRNTYWSWGVKLPSDFKVSPEENVCIGHSVYIPLPEEMGLGEEVYLALWYDSFSTGEGKLKKLYYGLNCTKRVYARFSKTVVALGLPKGEFRRIRRYSTGRYKGAERLTDSDIKRVAGSPDQPFLEVYPSTGGYWYGCYAGGFNLHLRAGTKQLVSRVSSFLVSAARLLPTAEELAPRTSASTRHSVKYIVRGERRYEPHHNILEEKYIRHLKRRSRNTKIKRNDGFIDLVYRAGGETTFAELKPCQNVNPKFAAREAVGQLLEYCYRRPQFDRREIVLGKEPNDSTKRFLRSLNIEPVWLDERGRFKSK